MNLTADMRGHFAALTAAEGGYLDAARSGNIAGLEIEVSGDLRVGTNERSVRTPILALSFTPETGRTLAFTLIEALGIGPAFTEPEWRRIAAELESVGRSYEAQTGRPSELVALAARIDAAYR